MDVLTSMFALILIMCNSWCRYRFPEREEKKKKGLPELNFDPLFFSRSLCAPTDEIFQKIA